jgi:hypothetical protein
MNRGLLLFGVAPYREYAAGRQHQKKRDETFGPIQSRRSARHYLSLPFSIAASNLPPLILFAFPFVLCPCSALCSAPLRRPGPLALLPRCRSLATATTPTPRLDASKPVPSVMSVINKRQQARNERALHDLIKSVPGNDRCADCAAKNPGPSSPRGPNLKIPC